MGRITRHAADRPESYEGDVDTLDRGDAFLETAGRLREPHVREQAHPSREAEIDAESVHATAGQAESDLEEMTEERDDLQRKIDSAVEALK